MRIYGHENGISRLYSVVRKPYMVAYLQVERRAIQKRYREKIRMNSKIRGVVLIRFCYRTMNYKNLVKLYIGF